MKWEVGEIADVTDGRIQKMPVRVIHVGRDRIVVVTALETDPDYDVLFPIMKAFGLPETAAHAYFHPESGEQLNPSAGKPPFKLIKRP